LAVCWVKWDPILSLIRQYALDVPIYIANHTFLILTGDDMELSQEESEVVAWFLSQHWSEFSEIAEEYLSASAVHRLAEKLGLENRGA